MSSKAAGGIREARVIVFLETSACLRHAIRFESGGRKVHGVRTDMISSFIGSCKENPEILLATSETVIKEARGKISLAVNKTVKEVFPKNYFSLRRIAVQKCQRRLDLLLNNIETVSVSKPPFREVDDFYQNLLKNRDKRLYDIENSKERKGLLPSKNDITILAEAVKLQRDLQKPVVFVSDDMDFHYFSEDIERIFHFKVLAVKGLPVGSNIEEFLKSL